MWLFQFLASPVVWRDLTYRGRDISMLEGTRGINKDSIGLGPGNDLDICLRKNV